MAALYRNLVEPDHENCAKIEIALQEYIIKARALFGDAAIDKVGDIEVEYYGRGRNAAMAVFGKNRLTKKPMGLIQFSFAQVMRRFVYMSKQIVPHELAHVICMANNWDMGHGQVWKAVCVALGGNGNTRHTLQTTDGRLKNSYEARCDQGLSYWLTGPQMRIAASAGLLLRTEDGKEFALTKKSLTGKIKPLEY
jgi:predicted SprT family Zn-dependent metalloprotease